MAYVYICDFCRESEHMNCEEHQNIPSDPHVAGGGVCICSHALRPEDRGKFEASVWKRYE